MMRWLWVFALLLESAAASCFEARLEEARAASAPVIQGEGGWLFLPAELRFLCGEDFVSETAPPEQRDPVAAIEDFARQLKEEEVALLLAPVPPKALVHASRLGCAPEEAVAAAQRSAAFYDELRKRGIAVLDLTEELLASPEPPYCRTDTHWSGEAIRRAAAGIRAWLSQAGCLPAKADETSFRVEAREVDITGDLIRLGGSAAPETLTLEFVSDASGLPPAVDTNSPVLLMGDSHVLVFHAGADLHATGAGLPDRLAAVLGRPVDVLGVRGSGATASRISLMRRIRANPSYLAGKRVVIWCFAAREFTEADAWRKVTLQP